MTFTSSGRERASRRRQRVLVARRTNPLPLPPQKGMTLKGLHGRLLNAARAVEGAWEVLVLEREEAEEAEAEGTAWSAQAGSSRKCK